jgi:PLD-like domain/Type III restriction enzyme, res subunit
VSVEPPDVGLRSLAIRGRYRSDREDVVQEFYLPALSTATSYSRAVGYFTSTSMALFSRGIEHFARRGGTMRLVASPHLNADDIVDIERGYNIRAVIERVTLRELQYEASDTVLNGLGLVGRLIAEGRLDIKLAFVEQAGRIGIYHEKIGIFRDEAGDLIAFTGSSNETLGGLLANFESIEVYLGWLPGDGHRAVRIEDDFNDLWNDRTANLRIQPFPEVAREHLIEIAKRRPEAELPNSDGALYQAVAADDGPARLAIPGSLEVRGYQRQAVEAWFRHQGRGILKMATGTGKTKTAMIAACQLAKALQQREERSYSRGMSACW